MNRRNFLAFIPALSAVPIVGKAFEQDKEKIIIYQPEDVPIHIAHDIGSAENDKCHVLVVDNSGKILAVGDYYQIDHECPVYEESPLACSIMVQEGRLKLHATLKLMDGTTDKEFYHRLARKIKFTSKW